MFNPAIHVRIALIMSTDGATKFLLAILPAGVFLIVFLQQKADVAPERW